MLPRLALREKHFYPRPPCGGRLEYFCCFHAYRNFYPRPPCGGRRIPQAAGTVNNRFLSTSPLRGTTTCLSTFCPCPTEFLSTSPLRGTTFFIHRLAGVDGISIHVPLAGDDCAARSLSAIRAAFLSTSPLRGTTNILPLADESIKISIHVPLAGDDPA